jgi:protein-S-isoprenylcysteine O-methyltransferase Ste14
MTTMEMVGAPVVRWWKGERGEWYVAAQAALFLLIALGPATASWLPTWPAAMDRASMLLGAVLMIGGFAWIIVGGVQLAFARSLSALPRPTDTATLIDTGVFAWVRHPMYCGAIWATCGWALWCQGLLVLAYAALLAIFFDIKASREERSLGERFPEYLDYRKRVRKLLPFLY